MCIRDRRADHHERRAAAGRGHRGVRHLRHRAHEDDRGRHARRRPDRCHRRARASGPGHHATARHRELVGPGPPPTLVGASRRTRVDVAMTAMLLSPADLSRKRGLRRMRAVALSLLVFAALVFIATRNRDGAWGYVNTTAEAAMVGALADWFACLLYT